LAMVRLGPWGGLIASFLSCLLAVFAMVLPSGEMRIFGRRHSTKVGKQTLVLPTGNVLGNMRRHYKRVQKWSWQPWGFTRAVEQRAEWRHSASCGWIYLPIVISLRATSSIALPSFGDAGGAKKGFSSLFALFIERTGVSIVFFFFLFPTSALHAFLLILSFLILLLFCVPTYYVY